MADIGKTKPQILFCQWLNNKANWIPSLTGYLVKVRALIGKVWDTENWNLDVWKDLNETGLTEPLNSDESSLPAPVASPSMSEEINPASPEENVMTYCAEVVLQDAMTHFHKLSLQPL